MTFLNPAYLGALALASIPILIHLIRRRKVRIVPWAAWDFLLEARRRNRRRLRLEQLILLLLRIAIVCLTVLAFARPLFRALGLPLVAADARVHALIVLDNSYSMGYRQGGASDFERARQTADDLITRVLKPGDSVSLVLLSAKPEAALKEPTFDLGKARERLRTTRLSDRDSDYGVGAAFCAALLKEVRTPTKEVYWITDSQKAGFPESGRERARTAWKDLAAQARVTWINVASPDRENLCVEAPLFSRELVTPQAPVRIESVIRNYGASPKKDLLVHLNVDGRPAGSARVTVPAHGAAKAPFVYLFEKAGVHTGTIQLGQPDGLERDNTAWFAAKVREKLKALLINPHPGSDPTRDEAFYLATALAPTGASEGGRAIIQPTVHAGARLTGLDLRAYDAVIVTGLTDFAPTDRRALEDFVQNGGGLLLFPGPTTEPGKVNVAFGNLTPRPPSPSASSGQALGARSSLGKGESVTARGSASPFPVSAANEVGKGGGGLGLLPAHLGARRVLPEDNALTLNPATITHPALAVFRDTTEINLGSARFTLVYDLAPPTDDETVRIVCRFSGGQPALVERRFGQGKVILAAGTAGIGGGNLPYKPAFVPLVHQLVAYLATGPTAQRNLRLGEPLVTRFDVREANKPIRLTDPSGQTSLQKSTLGADGVTFRYANTGQAGLYRIGLAGSENADAFAVNLPTAESDLASADDSQIQAALGPARVQFARGSDDLLAVVRRSRRGTEVWRTLVLVVLPLLFLEGLLAQRFGRRG